MTHQIGVSQFLEKKLTFCTNRIFYLNKLGSKRSTSVLIIHTKEFFFLISHCSKKPSIWGVFVQARPEVWYAFSGSTLRIGLENWLAVTVT